MARRVPSACDVVVATFVLLHLPVGAIAQNRSFGELSGLIKPGDTISVTEADGRQINGKVAELTPSSITLLISRSIAVDQPDNTKAKVEELRTFPATAVRRIVHEDSRWNGALIGAVVGVGFPGLGMAFTYGYGGFAAGAAVGAAIGVGIDTLMNKTVYLSTQQTSRVTLSPVFGSGRRAVLVFIGF